MKIRTLKMKGIVFRTVVAAFSASMAHGALYLYDFNHLTRGTGGFGAEALLAGQDNWAWKSGSNFRVVGTVGSGSYATAGPPGGSATGAVYRPNNANWEFVIGDGNQFTIEWIGRVQSSRDMELGLGDASGNPIFSFGNRGAVWRFQDTTGTATTSTNQAPSGTSTYLTMTIAIDLAAYSGDGSASFSRGGSPIVGLENLAMGLLTAGVDGSDMKSLYLRSRDNADFDNIAITVVPEPGTAMILALGALTIAGIRRIRR